ncbi:MAG TPA: DUF3825 domain-containing protein [Stellaceae bacterium]|nr:DUF3825 domain-containing protein [Stellaceae bacterium]
MRPYASLMRWHREQSLDTVFAHFYPIDGDYDKPLKILAAHTIDGTDAWSFRQQRFIDKYARTTSVPKLRNYLNYTFLRLVDLEQTEPGRYFRFSYDQDRICFNTGLQNHHSSDLMATFQRYKAHSDVPLRPDWVYKGCFAPNDSGYRDSFGKETPDIAWYIDDSRDYVFDINYHLERDFFGHLFDRAKERAGLPYVSDEVVGNYLRGTLENLVPKIKRNYKIAIPVYYVEEKRMQLLLPFVSANNVNDVSCFVIERNDTSKTYCLKTIFDLDAAYFSARLITRPDRDWLDP